MNSIMTEYYPTFRMYQALREQLMDLVSDDDLRFSVSGDNAPLGALCVEIGETERDYIDSFNSFRIDFSFRNPEPGLVDSLSEIGLIQVKSSNE